MDSLITLAAATDFATVLAAGATALAKGSAELPPIETVRRVDLERFMGKWFVIANIPTFVEKHAYNAVERYRLSPDGTIDTSFYCRKGGFDGPRKVFRSRAYVLDESNAVWGMQFLWPFKADYRITYLSDDYTQTVIGRDKRDFVWVMARQPRVSESDYDAILARLERQGYDLAKIEKVPQHWERRPHVRK
jgi:apolipoprotein D and lipocalin family protein